MAKQFVSCWGLVLLVSTATTFGQTNELYNSNSAIQVQTRNIPAGTVVDPSTSLYYIIDAGANLRALVGADLTGYDAALATVDQGETADDPPVALTNPLGVGGASSIYNADGTVDTTKINQNFISITNTHPTAAVTVHFRYFNDECIDVLDFLVLLTCNDTLIFDPFDFDIPGTSFNTQTRIFGPAVGLFTPIRAADFASGRFLIFATAAGASSNADDYAEIRFPREFDGFIEDGTDDTTGFTDHCNNLQDDSYFGVQAGLVASNLHVFNSSAIVFNYLIGYLTTAVPFGGVFEAYGVNAWGLPAVDLTDDALAPLPPTGLSQRGYPDGDGPPGLGDMAAGGADGTIIMGGEPVVGADGVTPIVPINVWSLRNEVHGGDSAYVSDIPIPTSTPVPNTPDGIIDYDSWGGALASPSLFIVTLEEQKKQRICFVSIVHDFNGGKHSAVTPIAGVVDRSYNVNGAETNYVLQIYDSDENIFDVDENTPINISPPPFEAPTAVLNIVVDCLRVWVTDVKSDTTSVDDLSIYDLEKIASGINAFLANGGWIRFVRDHSMMRSNGDLNKYGTWVDGDLNLINDSTLQASFLTIGLYTMGFRGFGVGYYLHAAPSLWLVSETGDPTCNGICPGPETATP